MSHDVMINKFLKKAKGNQDHGESAIHNFPPAKEAGRAASLSALDGVS
jgi:hypothetical protein